MKAVRARRAAALAGLPLWLSLRRIRPVSDEFGFDRGTPVDRVYLEEFLDEHSTEVHGDVLEVKSPAYTHRFGGDRVTRAHVLDLDPANEKATIVADLCEPGSLPPQGYDCVILSQTLQFVRLPEAALANVWQSLRPGATLLLTVPVVSKLDHGPDMWRFTPAGLEELVRRACPGSEPEVVAYGNVLTCTAFLLGLAAQELRPRDLRKHDPNFPLLACARAVKTS